MEDRTGVWILAYMTALYAEMSKPRYESYTFTEPPKGCGGGVGFSGGGIIHRTDSSDADAAARAASLAVDHFDKFQQRVEGR